MFCLWKVENVRVELSEFLTHPVAAFAGLSRRNDKNVSVQCTEKRSTASLCACASAQAARETEKGILLTRR